MLYISEALVEQANYFKVLHGTMAPTQPILSAKHIRTKNDKTENIDVHTDKELKTDQPSKREVEFSLSDEMDDVKNKEKSDVKDDTRNINKNVSSVVDNQLVTIFEKSDNNSILENALSPPLSPNLTNAQEDTTASPNANSTATIELKIVEQNDKLEIKNDNDEKKCSKNSNDTLNSVEEKQLDKNSSQLDNKTSATNDLTIESKPLEIEEEKITNTSADNLVNDCIVDNAEEMCETMDNSSHLDINKNEPEVKLNYAKVNIENVLDSQICENADYETAVANVSEINNKNNEDDSTIENVTDLEDKVQIKNCGNVLDDKENSAVKKPQQQLQRVKVTEPIQTKSPHQIDENDDDNMSPICSTRPPLNSPRLKSKDILNDLPLTPDSSHSLDSSCEYSTSFEIKTFNAPNIPERSFSSESLNSETSIDSNDSKSSIKLAEAKFSKNGTLERQNSNGPVPQPPATNPTGLQVLMLWDNGITRASSRYISDLLAVTTTLEILNVGKNILSNDFVTSIKQSMKTNASLTSLGLQSVHLSNEGIKTLSEVLDFGGNVTLQRIDLRDNNLQVSGLASLNEVLKSNKSITRIDLDDVPRRPFVSILIFIFSL